MLCDQFIGFSRAVFCVNSDLLHKTEQTLAVLYYSRLLHILSVKLNIIARHIRSELSLKMV